MQIIAHIESDFKEKFGIPRQSGLVKDLRARIVFEPAFRSPEAVRGIEQYSYLWLIWQFDKVPAGKWSPTVRPPRLGGNTRLGVFATRSPFRPNPIGLSSVKLEAVTTEPDLGPVLLVSGADLLDGTPIYDIKPYIPYVDSHPDAAEGFTGQSRQHILEVAVSDDLIQRVRPDLREALKGVLAQDPRPAYQTDPDRVYGMRFADYQVKFAVDGDRLTVTRIEEVE